MNYLIIAESCDKNIDFIKNFVVDKSEATCVFIVDKNIKDESLRQFSDDDVYIIKDDHDIHNFAESFYNIFKIKMFNYDYILFLGSIVNLMFLYSLKDNKIIDSDIFPILSDFSPPLTDEELMIIDKFEKTFFICNQNSHQYDFIKIIKDFCFWGDSFDSFSEKTVLVEKEDNFISKIKKEINYYLQNKETEVIGFVV